jgi:hypothetical protein
MFGTRVLFLALALGSSNASIARLLRSSGSSRSTRGDPDQQDDPTCLANLNGTEVHI